MDLLFKRLFDIAVAATVLVLITPLLVIVAILVRLRLGAPILFRQPRIGRNERPFTILKFRTMLHGDAPDSERLTPFGRFLRETSVDELPELWNVLTGRMSLVGPRPLLPSYLPHYSGREKLRHSMRPGITGLAQVNGRNALTWDTRLELDAQYVEQFSFLNDLRILWRTITVVFGREGISAEGHATMQRLDVVRTSSTSPSEEV